MELSKKSLFLEQNQFGKFVKSSIYLLKRNKINKNIFSVEKK